LRRWEIKKKINTQQVNWHLNSTVLEIIPDDKTIRIQFFEE
jgi:hypothetical protein